MLSVTLRGINLIKSFESFSGCVYICPAGYQTIGYGHVVKEAERPRFAKGISTAEAECILQNDIRVSEQAVLRLIKVPLTNYQFDALVSFSFNVGGGALQRSALRMKINRQEHGEVPAELMKWVWGGGRKLAGLIRRRKMEAELYNHVGSGGL